jgi:tRNA A-37 threonylcarbamoyl transferase component Bud32
LPSFGDFMLTLPNYQLSTQIYESANSLVYRGIRKKDNQPVILKVLKEDYPTPAELTRYRQEYEITKSLKLDSVVKTYGIEKYQNTLVIILEDFGGESLKTATFENSSLSLSKRGISVADFLPLAIQITKALGQIHTANIIHKDINPANIVWNKTDNQLKIIDFGIASRLPRENSTLKNPEQLEGTLAYISPEQTGRMNRALDYRTDLYSLGVTFYELLTGKVPFESKDAMELVHCHIAKTPVPVCEVNPNVPPIISNIVMKLMAKNAEDRYQSAFGVKFDLDKCQENLTGLKDLSGLQFELAQHDFSGQLQIPQKLYGRDSEREELLTAFERVTKGNVEMMLVVGYSGIGKSVLVKEIYKSLTEKHGYFITGKFDQFQRNIPYSAIVKAFQELVQQLLTENEKRLSAWKKKLLTVLGPNGQVIIDVLPEIEWIIGKQPAVPQLGPNESQNRFNLVFQNVMRVFCQPEHPLVMFLDDLQWADSATLNLLKLIITAQDNTALFLIGAYRDNEVEPTHPLIMTLDKLRKESVTINQVTLKPLAFEHINQLIAESLHHDLEAVGSLTDLVMRKTGGNPFFVNQFLHTLYEEKLLKFIPPKSPLAPESGGKTISPKSPLLPLSESGETFGWQNNGLLYRSGINNSSSNPAPYAGQAGNIDITANQMTISDGGAINTSAINASGGNITINVREMIYLREQGHITTNVHSGSDDGGNINITNPRFILLNQGQITAQADTGHGGNIRIVAEQFIKSYESLISASSRLGLDGEVQIDSPAVDLDAMLVVLSGNPIEAKFPKGCGHVRTLEELNTFRAYYHPPGRPMMPGDFPQ